MIPRPDHNPQVATSHQVSRLRPELPSSLESVASQLLAVSIFSMDLPSRCSCPVDISTNSSRVLFPAHPGDIFSANVSLMAPYVDFVNKNTESPSLKKTGTSVFQSVMSKFTNTDGTIEWPSRPCVVSGDDYDEDGVVIFVMGTFHGKKQIAPVLRRFAAPIYNLALGDKVQKHIHTSPEWPVSPQWIITLPHTVPEIGRRWSHGGTIGYHLNYAAMQELQQLSTEQYFAFDNDARKDPRFKARYRMEFKREHQVS